jgi:uncharacterized membrane protein HdeD (DUF308 family)
MKKWNLFASLFQIAVGISAIVTYLLLAVNGESVFRWTVTLVLAAAFIVIGVIGIIDFMRAHKKS